MNDPELRLLLFIEQHKEEMIDFLRELIQTNSENPPGNERSVCNLIIEKMRGLGFHEFHLLSENEERPNLVFSWEGTDAKGLKTIFNAHMDTKPAGNKEEWAHNPFDGAIQDGIMYGLGTCDMKATLAAMIYAFAAISALGERTPGSLELMFTSDEEAGSKYGASYLAHKGLISADYVILGEPSGVKEDWETLCVVSRGVCCFKVKVYGDQMHSSLSDKIRPVNANVKMGKVLSMFKERLKLNYTPHPFCPDGPTVNPGVMINGGIYYGVNPGYSEFHCDIRTIPGMSKAQLEKDIRALLVELMEQDPELRLDLEFAPAPLDWIEPTEIDPDTPSVKALQRASEKVLGKCPPLGAFPGGTDSSYFQGVAGIPTVPSFGPGLLTVAHSPKEFVTIESVIQAAKIYALSAWELAQSTKS